MTGKDFEDRLIDALEDFVDDDGVVVREKQEFSMRRGNFQASQNIDIKIDSPYDDLYVGFEAKTGDADNAYGMYFSGMYKEDQIRKQLDYQEQSGRDIFVAVEIRSEENGDDVVILPIEYFEDLIENGEKRAEWDDMREVGVSIYDETEDALDITEATYEVLLYQK